MGPVGRLLNSGWNWTPTNQGWSGSSTISTSVRRETGPPPTPASTSAEVVVELIAVAVTLAISACHRPPRLWTLRQRAGIGAQAHGAALVGHALLVGHQVDDGMAVLELIRWNWRRPCPARGGRTPPPPSASPGRCRGRAPVLPGVRMAAIMPSMPRSPKPPGTSIPRTRQHLRHVLRRELLGVDPPDVITARRWPPARGTAPPPRQIGVVELGILADQRDRIWRWAVLARSTMALHSLRSGSWGRPNFRHTTSSRPSAGPA